MQFTICVWLCVFIMTLYRIKGGGDVLSSIEVEQTISEGELHVAWPQRVHFDLLQSAVPDLTN